MLSFSPIFAPRCCPWKSWATVYNKSQRITREIEGVLEKKNSDFSIFGYTEKNVNKNEMGSGLCTKYWPIFDRLLLFLTGSLYIYSNISEVLHHWDCKNLTEMIQRHSILPWNSKKNFISGRDITYFYFRVRMRTIDFQKSTEPKDVGSFATFAPGRFTAIFAATL